MANPDIEAAPDEASQLFAGYRVLIDAALDRALPFSAEHGDFMLEAEGAARFDHSEKKEQEDRHHQGQLHRPLPSIARGEPSAGGCKAAGGPPPAPSHHLMGSEGRTAHSSAPLRR